MQYDCQECDKVAMARHEADAHVRATAHHVARQHEPHTHTGFELGAL